MLNPRKCSEKKMVCLLDRNTILGMPTPTAKVKFEICKPFRKVKGCLHKIIGQNFCKKVRNAVDKEEEVLLEQVGSVVEDSASNLAIVESEGDAQPKRWRISFFSSLEGIRPCIPLVLVTCFLKRHHYPLPLIGIGLIYM